MTLPEAGARGEDASHVLLPPTIIDWPDSTERKRRPYLGCSPTTPWPPYPKAVRSREMAILTTSCLPTMEAYKVLPVPCTQRRTSWTLESCEILYCQYGFLQDQQLRCACGYTQLHRHCADFPEIGWLSYSRMSLPSRSVGDPRILHPLRLGASAVLMASFQG